MSCKKELKSTEEELDNFKQTFLTHISLKNYKIKQLEEENIKLKKYISELKEKNKKIKNDIGKSEEENKNLKEDNQTNQNLKKKEESNEVQKDAVQANQQQNINVVTNVIIKESNKNDKALTNNTIENNTVLENKETLIYKNVEKEMTVMRIKIWHF